MSDKEMKRTAGYLGKTTVMKNLGDAFILVIFGVFMIVAIVMFLYWVALMQ